MMIAEAYLLMTIFTITECGHVHNQRQYYSSERCSSILSSELKRCLISYALVTASSNVSNSPACSLQCSNEIGNHADRCFNTTAQRYKDNYNKTCGHPSGESYICTRPKLSIIIVLSQICTEAQNKIILVSSLAPQGKIEVRWYILNYVYVGA